MISISTRHSFRPMNSFAIISRFVMLVLLSTFCSVSLAAISAPDDLTGAIDGTTATLEWSPVTNANGYNVYRNDAYLTTTSSIIFNDTVEDGEVYHYYVVAFSEDPVEYSAATDKLTLPASAVPTDLTIPPTVPDQLTGDITGTSVSISWAPSTDDESVAGYNLYRNNQYITTVQDPHYTGSVVEGEAYVFKVAAFDIRQNFSATSDGLFLPLSAEPPDPNSPPTVPTELSGTVTGPDNTQIQLSWVASTDNQLVQGYNVYQDNAYITTVATNEYSGSIPANQFASFSVVAFDNDGNFSANSAQLLLPDTGEPRDTTIAPDVVTGLSSEVSTGSGLTTVMLSWDASTDDYGVAGYNVYQDNSYLTTVNDTAHAVSIAEDSTHNWSIVAFDHDGNFSANSEKLRYPDNGPDTTAPSAPANLLGSLNTVAANTSVSLEWVASTDNVRVLGYNVYENNAYVTTVYDTTFEKSVAADGVYSYFVVAFDDSNNFSAPSTRVNLPEADNIAPYFNNLQDTTVFAGESLSLLIQPVDPDGGAPGLMSGPLPTGMILSDNMDGTRTLNWQVLQPEVGIYDIDLTAMDADDPALTTTQVLRITVEMPDDPSTIPNLPPGINLIEEQLVRAGDTVNMRVKGTDPNGTIPVLTLLNPPANSTFTIDPEDPEFKVLRWTTANEPGVVDLEFVATDSVDSSLTVAMSVQLDILDPAQFERPGARLRDLAAQHDLDIGYAQVLKSYDNPDADLYRDIAAEEFNIVTAENSMKWGYINPEPGVYRWDSADDLVEFAAANDMTVHGHTLLWYTVLPAWVMNSAPADREDIMNTFIDVMTTRYPDVALWDVVNEAFEEDGSYRQSIWYQAMGKDYIAKAFLRARDSDPDADLIYNDYNIAWENAKSDATYALMQQLQADGIPIDGIGFQMHVDTDFSNYDSVRETFDRFAALGLDIHITEMDVSMLDGATEDEQATVYGEILDLCLAQSACKTLQMWGYTDRYSWLSQYDPLIFDRNYQPKPAYIELQNRLMGNE